MVQIQVKRSFDKVKEDINMLKNVQQSFAMTVKKRLDSNQDMGDTIKRSIDELRRENEEAISLLNKSFQESREHIQSEILGHFEQLETRTNEIRERLQFVESESRDTHKDLNILSGKFQELDNLSMDVADMEKVFVSRDDLKKVVNQKEFRKMQAKMDKLDSNVYDMIEAKQGLATAEELKNIEKSIIDLKDNLVFRNDIEQMSDRIDLIESNNSLRLDKLQNQFDKIENDLTKVYGLKNHFVSKEQHKIIRKEMKLLVTGLKDIQKLKNQIMKLRKS